MKPEKIMAALYAVAQPFITQWDFQWTTIQKQCLDFTSKFWAFFFFFFLINYYLLLQFQVISVTIGWG